MTQSNLNKTVYHPNNLSYSHPFDYLHNRLAITIKTMFSDHSDVPCKQEK
jgi:hypothetical protein